MLRFSANIGFLWPELAFVDRIHAAASAGFDAVECHFPYDTPVDDVRTALTSSALPMLGLNTVLGVNGPDDFGVAARPDRIDEARAAIDQALAYADAVGCANVNVVPGKTGRSTDAENTYRSNLRYACEQASAIGKGILIEPINTRAAPGFHLTTIDQAIETIDAVGHNNLKLMYDVFHVQIMQGDLLTRIEQSLPYLGHIQISAVHDRGEPDEGEVSFPYLLQAIDDLGWTGYIGAEYRPRTTTDAGLAWLTHYR